MAATSEFSGWQKSRRPVEATWCCRVATGKFSVGSGRVVKKSPVWKALLGIALLGLGGAAEFATGSRYTEQRVVANAGSCRIDVSIIESVGESKGQESGAVVLFHGISANKVIMRYLARAFAEQGLRVYVPDLPGHGRSAGPFTPAAAEECAMSFVRGLAARGLISPERTILAGHSMGGAIALRVAAKFRPAGVVAISPAPMVPAHGVSPELLLFQKLPVLQPNTLILVGKMEPQWLRDNAKDLAAASPDPSVQFKELPLNSHVSVLFSPTVARLSQEWAAKALRLPAAAPRLPSRLGLLGGLFGVVAILLIAGPFLEESIGEHAPEVYDAAKQLPYALLIGEFALVSLAVVVLLRYWIPLKVIHLFEGDYLASFFVAAGLALSVIHLKLARAQFRIKASLLFAAFFAGLVMELLLTGWMQLTLAGTWLTLDRWSRFPLFFLAAFLFLYALESVLGPVVEGAKGRRWLLGFALVFIAWLALAFGVAVLHSGEILLVLLSPYFGLLVAFIGSGAQLVRQKSGSATAAAVFGAILLGSFCLVLFPVS